MKRVIVFDLDDTLYDEYTYVKSGFLAVATYLEEIMLLDRNKIYETFWEQLLEEGRGAIFDSFLEKHNLFTKELVDECLAVYRNHTPQIHLEEDVVALLQKLKSIPLYVITDGNVIVQQNKIKALGLDAYVKRAIPSYIGGEENGKPSPYWFNYIAHQENVPPESIVYIGDNPKKDFIGIKPLGFKTIRVKMGEYANLHVPLGYEAEWTIENLQELLPTLNLIWPDFNLGGSS